MTLTLSVLKDVFAICRFAPDSPVPAWALAGDLYSITRTTDELSIVCAERHTEQATQATRGWRCFKVHGPLDFSLTGVMASLAAPLAEARISMFVFSTFDTDYLMIKESDLERAIVALTDAGHEVRENIA